MRYPQPYVDFAPGMMALHSRGRDDSSNDEDDENDAQDRPSQRSLNQSPNPSTGSRLNRESSRHSRNVREDSTSHGLNFSETSSVATSIATSQDSSRVSSSQHRRKRHPWEHLGGKESLLGSRAKSDDHTDQIRRGGASTRPTRDLHTRSSSRSVSTASSGSPPRVRTTANHSMHMRSENDRLELSTHSTQSRTRYAFVDTQTSERQIKASAFSFQHSQSVQYLNQSHRASARQADPVPITASAVFNSLMGYAVDLAPEKKFHRGVDPPKEKPPTLTSLFRLHEEEAEGYEEIRVRQGIELSRQTQKAMQKSNYEVDAPPVTSLMVLPEFQGQGMEKEQWKLPNRGQELDQSSTSEADAGSFKSLDSMDELGRSEFVGRFLERDHQPSLQESIASLEANLQVEEDMFDASQEIRDAEEQLENLDHAGAVINSFNRMMEQTKLKPRRNEYAMHEGMPSLRSFGSITAELKEDLNRNENLALTSFIQNMMLSIENDLFPAQAKLTDVFKWSEKDNIDNVERSRFRNKDGSERCSTPKRVSRADVFFTLNKSRSLPAALSTSRLTTNDGDMNEERFVDTVSNSEVAEVAGTPGSYESAPVDSELAEQERTKDGKDVVVLSSSLKPPYQVLEELSTSKSLRLSSSVTLTTADELGIQHSKSAVVGTSGADASSQDSQSVLDVLPNVAQQEVTMVADVMKVGKVGIEPASNDIDRERLISDTRTNDVAADSGSTMAMTKKTNIERTKLKLAEHSSAMFDDIVQRTSLAATNYSQRNNEEGESEKDRDSKQTALPARISLKELQRSRDRKASEVSMASTTAAPSSNSTIVKNDYTDEYRPVMNPPALMMAEPIVDVKVSVPLDLKLLSTTQADVNEERAQKSKSAQILSSNSNKNHDKRQQKANDVKSERPGRLTGNIVRSRSSEYRRPDLNGSRDNSMPENLRRSKRAQEPGPQKVKPDFVTAFNESSSFRQADVDGRGAEPAPAPGKRDFTTSKSLHLAPSRNGGATRDDNGQGNEILPASATYDDDHFKSLSISPEEVLAALMRGGAARKAQRASTVASELNGESSKPSLSLPASKVAKTRSKVDTRTARTSVAVVGDRQPSKSTAMPSNTTSSRSPKLDKAVNIDTRRSRSLKAYKSNRSSRRSTSLSSDDDSIKFTKPTFRKAPSRRSISQPSMRARKANAISTTSPAGDDKRSPVQPSTSPLKAQVHGQSTIMPVSTSPRINAGEILRTGGSQVDKNSPTPARAGTSSGALPEPQINHEIKSSKTVNADVKVGRSKTKSASSPPDRERKSSHRRERSIRSSHSPSPKYSGKS